MTSFDLITKQDLADFKTELFAELKKLNISTQANTEDKRWLRSAEVRHLLSISPGTLQNLRIKGTLPFKKIGGIMYYAYTDIENLLQQGGKA